MTRRSVAHGIEFGQVDTVTTPPLDPIERVIRAMEQGFKRLAIRRLDGNADAQGRFDRKLGLGPDKRLRKSQPKPFCSCNRLLRSLVPKQDNELIPAMARNQIASVHDAERRPGESLQDPVTERMSAQIVQLLEMIEIDEKVGS